MCEACSLGQSTFLVAFANDTLVATKPISDLVLTVHAHVLRNMAVKSRNC